MGRVPRWRMGKGVYHVFNRGINSAWILSTPEERDYFCKLLSDQRKYFKVEIYHYVVMSNHFHLAIETLETKTLSAYIGRVSALYSKYWHRTKKAGNGTVWQGRFKSIIVQKELYLNRLGRYIERNPITADIEGITNPSDYKWSSATAYISGINCSFAPSIHTDIIGETVKRNAAGSTEHISATTKMTKKEIFLPKVEIILEMKNSNQT